MRVMLGQGVPYPPLWREAGGKRLTLNPIALTYMPPPTATVRYALEANEPLESHVCPSFDLEALVGWLRLEMKLGCAQGLLVACSRAACLLGAA